MSMTETSVSQPAKMGTSISKQNIVETGKTPASLGGASILLMVLLNAVILQNALLADGSYKYLLITLPLLLLSIIDHYRHVEKHH